MGEGKVRTQEILTLLHGAQQLDGEEGVAGGAGELGGAERLAEAAGLGVKEGVDESAFLFGVRVGEFEPDVAELLFELVQHLGQGLVLCRRGSGAVPGKGHLLGPIRASDQDTVSRQPAALLKIETCPAEAVTSAGPRKVAFHVGGYTIRGSE